MKRRTTPKRRVFKGLTKKTAFFVILAGLLVAGVLYFTVLKDDSNQTVNKPITTKSSGSDETSLSPPTQTEKQQAEANKEQIIKRDEQLNKPSPTPQAASGLRQVNITIADISSDRVAASVGGVVEDGGKCTATAIKGSQTLTQTSEGFKNNSYTQCTVEWGDNTLDKGEWTVTLSYKSTTAEGTASKTKEVQ
jgi:hypothetical protein